MKNKCRYPRLIIGLAIVFNLALVSADELHIAVAANFTMPIEQLKLMFGEESGHDVIVSAGSTGQLYVQIHHGAPYQVFLAADRKRPNLLVKEGLAVAESLFTYAIGQLLLWSPQTNLVDSTGKILTTNDFKHLAIAHPKMAPYGAATKQVLEKLGLWQALQSKMVRGNNINQAYQFTATGNAELGFIAFSQYKVIAKKSRGSHWLVPKEFYDPIRQGAVLIKQDKNQSAAQAFIKFLRSPSARQVIKKFGYALGD